jgi:hypothetical protein
MTWQQIREHYPNEWLLIEATKASSQHGRRILESMTVLDVFPDGASAWQAYSEVHKNNPKRELFPVHTSKEILEIEEHVWLGVRSHTMLSPPHKNNNIETQTSNLELALAYAKVKTRRDELFKRLAHQGENP